MSTLVAINPPLTATPHQSSTLFPHLLTTRFHLNRKYYQHAIRKRVNGLRRHSYSGSVSASCDSIASECNGWDDSTIGSSWSIRSGESSKSNQIIEFMVSIGIDDKKYLYVFVLGIVCSMAISRVRIGWIFVLPVLVAVFGLGFALGFVRSVSDEEPSSGNVRRKDLVRGDDRVGVVVERLKGVVGFFNKLDARIGELRSYVNRAVCDKHVTIGELERCVVELDSARSLALPNKGVVEACVVELSEWSVKAMEPVSGEKGEESDGFGFLKSVGTIFGDKQNHSKTSRVKESKQDCSENGMDRQASGIADDQLRGSEFNLLINDPNVSDSVLPLNNVKRMRVISHSEELDRLNSNGDSRRFSTGEDRSYLSNKMRFADNSRLSFKLRQRNEIETWSSSDGLLDSTDFSYKLKRTQTEASFEKEEIHGASVESLESSRMFEHDDEDISIQNVRKARMPLNDDHFVRVAGASSSAISNDVLFDRHLTEANELLKHARDCLKVGDTEDMADDMLYKSSDLLKIALEMKPLSLLAVGLLGNTYLLHGELKLKVSRKLRSLIRKSRSPRRDWQGRGSLDLLDDQVVNKDALATLLVNTCEECEHLLVEAGRKYRMALSIDGNDVKSLYNWGLALSFRAQLISDIGPVSLLFKCN